MCKISRQAVHGAVLFGSVVVRYGGIVGLEKFGQIHPAYTAPHLRRPLLQKLWMLYRFVESEREKCYK